MNRPVRILLLAGALLAGLLPPALAQKVRLATSAGDIVLQLDREKAPKTVDNFVAYVKSGHYAGTIFHRVIPNFMIQGGGMDKTLAEKKSGTPIPLESRNGLSNVRGAVAMARTSDPNSATAQFFINVADNSFLNWGDPRGDGNGYAVFGKVISGQDVVTKIAKTPTGPGGPFPSDVPRQPVVIESMTVVGAQK